jgi:hypothetical protein
MGSCALSVQANRRTPFANRRMKFYPRTITETLRARLKRNSLAATRPGVRKDRLSRDVIIINYCASDAPAIMWQQDQGRTIGLACTGGNGDRPDV